MGCGGAVCCISLQGETSPWFEYLESLPQDIVDIALFWECGHGGGDYTDSQGAETDDACINFDDLNSTRRRHLDGIEAIAWLRGTEVSTLR